MQINLVMVEVVASPLWCIVWGYIVFFSWKTCIFFSCMGASEDRHVIHVKYTASIWMGSENSGFSPPNHPFY